MNALFYVALAMLAGLLLTRVVKLAHLPNVTGYLVAGLLIGPSCLNLVGRESLAGLDILSSMALGFIAFSIGVEFKLSSVRHIGGRCIVITLCQALGAVLLVDLALCACGFELPLALTLGAIATATAPAATLMVVRQYRAKGPVTNTLLPVVAMDDAIGLVIFSISVAVAGALSGGAAAGFTSVIVKPFAEILLSLLAGGALGVLAALSMRLFHSRANRLCVCVMLVLLGCGLAARFGLSDLLLCMAAGAVYVNLFDDSPHVLEGMDAWTPPLFLLFFVISGAELDLAILPSVGLLGLVYLLARSLGKYFGAFAGAAIVRAEPNIRKYLGVTLLPQAGVAIGMAQIAVAKLPAYGARIQAVVLAATLVYELAGPVLTKLALQRAGEITIEARRPKRKRA
ncbi:MAG: cation:proton antiporter [Clostridia bacterium]|nr:cation:proton antiporter [Clostridia bacterium]